MDASSSETDITVAYYTSYLLYLIQRSQYTENKNKKIVFNRDKISRVKMQIYFSTN